MVVVLIIAAILWTYFGCKKRTESTSDCPNCGTNNHATPWATGLQRNGYPLRNYKCKKCGCKWMD